MAAASAAGRPHGMLSVIGLGDDALEPLCAAAVARAPPDTVCQIANLLFPTGRVVSGHKDALAEVRGIMRSTQIWHCQRRSLGSIVSNQMKRCVRGFEHALMRVLHGQLHLISVAFPSVHAHD